MTPKVKSILAVCGIVASFPLLVLLLVLFHDFLYIFIIIVTFFSCLGLTMYGLYEVILEEMTRRSKIHEDLYHGQTPEMRRWLDFFLTYFGDNELK
jgi:hypothetical protein